MNDQNFSQDGNEHSALASWAGYDYQGLCALCVVLNEMLKAPESTSDWQLVLEAEEDFVIRDSNCKIVSLHQCKNYKEKHQSSIRKEFRKILQKKKRYESRGRCAPDYRYFLHTNIDVELPEGILKYSYDVKCSDSGTDAILIMESILSALVGRYHNEKLIKKKKDFYVACLERILDKHIGEIESVARSGNQISIFEAAKNTPLRFSEIKSILDNLFNLDASDIGLCFCLEIPKNMKKHLQCEIENGEEISSSNEQKKYIEHFIKKMGDFFDHRSDNAEKKRLEIAARMCPDLKILGDNHKDDEELYHELHSPDRANALYEVIRLAGKCCDEELNWREDDGLITPSSLVNPKKNTICKKIIEQAPHFPELMRDYRWIAAEGIKTVDDVYTSSNNVTKPADAELSALKDSHGTENSNLRQHHIVHPGKLGIRSYRSRHDSK